MWEPLGKVASTADARRTGFCNSDGLRGSRIEIPGGNRFRDFRRTLLRLLRQVDGVRRVAAIFRNSPTRPKVSTSARASAAAASASFAAMLRCTLCVFSSMVRIQASKSSALWASRGPAANAARTPVRTEDRRDTKRGRPSRLRRRPPWAARNGHNSGT